MRQICHTIVPTMPFSHACQANILGSSPVSLVVEQSSKIRANFPNQTLNYRLMNCPSFLFVDQNTCAQMCHDETLFADFSERSLIQLSHRKLNHYSCLLALKMLLGIFTSFLFICNTVYFQKNLPPGDCKSTMNIKGVKLDNNTKSSNSHWL